MSSFTGIGSMVGISTFRNVSAGGGDATPNAVNWSDIVSNENTGEVGYSSKQITGIDTNITLSASSVSGGGLYYKISDTQVTGVIINLINEGYVAIPSGGGNLAAVSNNKWVTFANAMGSSQGSGTTITIRNVTDENAVVDTFVMTFIAGGCFLTTTIVDYFGLADDGPELTAMRSLREHYQDEEGYGAILYEYRQVSPQIISAIQEANAESTEYNYIYNTVLAVKGHVDLGEWQQAHDLYMAMYADLKARYLGT